MNAEQIEHLEYVDRATVDLSEMIDDFLDSARLRAGLLRLDRRALEAREVYELVEPALASRAACKDVTLEIDMPESLPGVFADLYKASRAFTNIAVNAIKCVGLPRAYGIGPTYYGAVTGRLKTDFLLSAWEPMRIQTSMA